ncbi:outer membrane lipoprotein-sorting protein [Methylocaldum sp.]|uniref:outer membrane lipoprotein-sorting protein n=1 Tax=Methylocaldum sp. TaxID=1969727 RepID=UPI00321F7589
MKSVLFFVTGALLLALSASVAAEDMPTGETPSAVELLRKADEYRNFKGKSFAFELKLRSIEPDEAEKIFLLKAEILNAHTSLIIYADPVSERGKALLMDQSNLWFHSPLSSKPIRITPQQRLLGEASNGDVASTDFSGDYDPTYLRRETVDGIPCHVLELKAKPDSLATYDKLHLWIQEKNFMPYQAEFFAATGKLLKTARYTRYEKLPDLGGKEQLVTIEIQNPLSAGKKTIMEYSQFKVTELPVSRFTVSALSRLR